MVFGSRAIGLIALLLAAPGLAQRVVILELDHDPGGRLRAQVEAAVDGVGGVSLVPLTRYKSAAARRRLKGPLASTGVAVARVSRRLKLDAAVGGAVEGATYHVLIYDRAGQELWTKDLALTQGRLSDELAVRLARAIAAAGAQGAVRPSPSVEPEGFEGPDADADADDEPAANEPAVEAPTEAPPPQGGGPSAEGAVPGPPVIRGHLVGITTWRSQCLRPGVSRCADYELASPKPPGVTVDFGSTVPYLGFSAAVEFFPLARFVDLPVHRFFNGLGLVGRFTYGNSTTRIVEETAQGSGPPKNVTSLELAGALELVYRVHLRVGYGTPQPVGFAGLRAGVAATTFTIDPTVSTSLPSSRRLSTLGFGYPTVGVEASVPLVPFFRVDLLASLFLNPRPAAEQVLDFGDPSDASGGVRSTGFLLEGGFSGQLIGPLGWMLHVRHQSFVDRFSGQGQKWTACGTSCVGVGEESYTQLLWGLSGQY